MNIRIRTRAGAELNAAIVAAGCSIACNLCRWRQFLTARGKRGLFLFVLAACFLSVGIAQAAEIRANGLRGERRRHNVEHERDYSGPGRCRPVIGGTVCYPPGSLPSRGAAGPRTAGTVRPSGRLRGITQRCPHYRRQRQGPLNRARVQRCAVAFRPVIVRDESPRRWAIPTLINSRKNDKNMPVFIVQLRNCASRGIDCSDRHPRATIGGIQISASCTVSYA